MVSFDEVGIALYVDRFAHSSARLKELFVTLDEAFLRLGVVPTRMAAGRPGKKGGYATYRGLKPRLMKSDFTDVQNFTLECLLQERSIRNYRSWKAQASAGHQMRLGFAPGWDAIWQANWAPTAEHNERWHLNWTIFPEDSGLGEGAVLDEILRFAPLAMDEYGYIAWLRRGTEPALFDFDIGFPGEESGHSWSHRRDQRRNRITWTRFGCWTNRLLRDVYPVNFLGRSYLDLPMDGGTLEEWILADPLRRGTLEPLNGRVWAWCPVIRWLPSLREPLFRAGLLHWWRMFGNDDIYQLQVAERFVPPDETPAMFLPAYYSDRDPKVTS